MGSRRIPIAILGIAIALSVLSAPAAAATGVRYVDDDGRAGPKRGCDGSREVPTGLQPAIDASARGDTVRVCPGTYIGKVFIRSDNDGLRLVAATDTRPVLRPPRSGAAVVLVVRGARGVVIEGLRFRPHGGRGSCTEVSEFIRVLTDSRVRIVDNVFAGLEPYTGSCNRYGAAVTALPPVFVDQRVEFSRNVVRDFRYAAVSVSQFDEYDLEAGATLRVTDNRIVVGQPQDPDPNGFVRAAVSTSFGGRVVITDNVLRVDPLSRRRIGLVSAYPADGGLVIRRNVASGIANGIDIQHWGTDPARIEDNTLRGRTFRQDDSGEYLVGMFLGGENLEVARNVATGFTRQGILTEASFLVVEDNDFRGNGGIDCHEDGDGEVDGWRRNLGDESDPAGLCSPG